jgi:hypothetical protein
VFALQGHCHLYFGMYMKSSKMKLMTNFWVWDWGEKCLRFCWCNVASTYMQDNFDLRAEKSSENMCYNTKESNINSQGWKVATILSQKYVVKKTIETWNNKGCVTRCPCHFTLKSKHLKAKGELWKLKYFTMQKYNLQNNPLKKTKILQDIIITLL